ncbi:MAG: PIN domain-containing protein [Candidatus Sungiibacteriota bacterium]
MWISSVIGYENSFNPAPERKKFVDDLMRAATGYVNLDEAIRCRATDIQKTSKLHALDALHIACAEAAGVDFFVTCDYTVIKRYQGNIRVVSPIAFIHEYEKHYPA